MTGLSDTQIDLTRDRPSWFPPGKSLQLPTSLLETRHCIVHRHLPTLAELKRASTAALVWLWEWYWAQLDSAFSLSPTQSSKSSTSGAVFTLPADTPAATLKNKLHALLRLYIKERKLEIKSRAASPSSAAARSFVSTYTLRFAPNRLPTPSSTAAQSALLRLLVGGGGPDDDNSSNSNSNDADALLLPAPRKPLNMPGALAIWSPLLHALCAAQPAQFPALVSALTGAMNSGSSTTTTETRREALCAWAAHVLCDGAWAGVRAGKPGVGDEVLVACFSAPEGWNLRLAERVLESGVVKGGREMWGPVLEAAREDEGEMVVDGGEKKGGEVVEDEDEDEGGEGAEKDEGEDGDGGEPKSVLVERAVAVTEEKKGKTREQIRGPVKVLGLWKPRPIGTLPEGWDEDE
jgi:ribosomal biogenesis protein LAS1